MTDESLTGTEEALPANGERIEVHVAQADHLFNAIDPSPLRERDLSDSVQDFIVSWAREAHRSAPLILVVYVDRPLELADAHTVIRDAVHTFFDRRALLTRRRLRQLFRVGRISLLIGLFALAATLLLGSIVERAFADHRIAVLVRESLLIGGWVAMWRPLEIFLYEWWPIRADRRLYDRLRVMPVVIERSQARLP